jgi:hypothetical protein
VPVEECADGVAAQGGQLEPSRVRSGDEVAEDGPQRMVDLQRVAVGQHQQQGKRGDPAGEEPHEVQRRLVGPVQVLHDQYPRAGPECVERRREDLVLGRRAPEQAGHVGGQLVRHVTQRTERPRCAERVAHAPQRRCLQPLDEGAQQSGLADPGVAGDEDGGTPAGDGSSGMLFEHVEGMLALQQAHGPIVLCESGFSGSSGRRLRAVTARTAASPGRGS